MKNHIYLILVAIHFFHGNLFCQHEEFKPELIGTPKFYFDAVTLNSGEKGVSRLDVYIEVPYEALHFTKNDEVFQSRYELSINVYDSLETLVVDKWWTEKVETREYKQSISPVKSNLSQRTFMLTPGKYFVAVQIKDTETDKVTRMKRKIDVRDYYAPKFSVSDIILVNSLEFDSGKAIMYPNISGNIGGARDSFYIYFEAYNAIGAESAHVGVMIHNVKGDIVQKDSFMQVLEPKKKSCFFQIPTSRLIAGDYLIEVKAEPKLLNGAENPERISSTATRKFIVRLRGLPVSIVNLDLAIDQLQYILDRDKLEEIRKAPPERKTEMFRDFWKKKDPTPTTEKNELMDEYYGRIQYANQNFGHYIDGWKTDMGMVYVIFGSPSNIERHPFELDSKPYEIWTYYDLGREFIFVDMGGFGDYRLQTPLWDVNRTRIR